MNNEPRKCFISVYFVCDMSQYEFNFECFFIVMYYLMKRVSLCNLLFKTWPENQSMSLPYAVVATSVEHKSFERL